MKRVNKIIAKIVKATAIISLKRDANQTTCGAIYQPCVPTKLVQLKKGEK